MSCLRVSAVVSLLCASQLLTGATTEIYTGSVLVNATGQESGALAAALGTLGARFRSSGARPAAGGSAFSLVQSLCEHLSHGVFALTAQASGHAQTQTLLSFCRRLALPCLLVSPWSEPERATPGGASGGAQEEQEEEQGVGGPVTPISLAPNPGEALADLLHYYGWSDFVFLHDGGDPSTLSWLLSSPRGPWEVTALSVEALSSSSLRSLLGALDWDQRHRHLVIDCADGAVLRGLLRQVVAMGKHIRGYNYILTSLDFSVLDLTAFSHGGANVSGLQLLDFSRSQLLDMVQRWRAVQPLTLPSQLATSLTASAALTYDSLLVVREAVRRVEAAGGSLAPRDATSPCLQSSWEHGHTLAHAMRQVQLEGASGPVGFDARGRRSRYSLHVMELGRDGPTKIGYWNPEERLVVTKLPETSPDLGKINRTLVITTIMDSPFVMMKQSHAALRGNARYEGYVVDLVEELSRELGFRYSLQLVPDGRYGIRDHAKTWHGMVGEVLYGRADMAVAPLTISYERASVVDFTRPFMTVGISMMVKRAAAHGATLSLLAPLRYDAWLCLVMAFIGVGFVLFVLTRFSPYEGGPPRGGESAKVAVGNSLWGVFNVFTQQGREVAPRAWSVRVLAGAWAFFALLLVSVYTANLAALLVTEQAISAVGSVEELAQQGAVHYGTVESGSTQSFFRESKFPVYARMWAAMQSWQPSPFVRSNAEGVARVRAAGGRFAFLLESATNEYISQRMPCDTQRVGHDVNQRGYGIALPRGAPLRDALDRALLKLNEGGVLQQIKQKWWYDKGECGNILDRRQGPRALGVSSLASHFYLLLAGVALAVFVATLEKCVRPAGEAYEAKPAGEALG